MSTGKCFKRTAALAVPIIIAGAALAACSSPPVTVASSGYEQHHHHKPTPTHRPRPTPTVSTPSTAPTTATPTSTPTSSSTGTTGSVPLPAALKTGHPLVKTFSPATMATPPWSTPTNAPGNCSNANKSAHVNASGYAEIDTTGANGDCVSLQSPGTLPTAPGYVYETRINFSSFHDWPALWMYGPQWPQQGEIDAVEGGPGQSYVTWHEAGNKTIGPDPWDDVTVPHAGGPNIQPGAWTTVDISFTTTGVDVYYGGQLYVHVPESVTTSGSDPMFLVVSEGSCNADGTNVCNGGTSPAGSVQVASVTEFS